MAKVQTLSFPIRLPERMQAEALRLLDASREAINALIEELWPSLDQFAGARTGIAWKQVEALLPTRSGHGNRQERCEMEQAGRILRAQATRKQVFQTVLPLLTDALIVPAAGKRKARKEYRHIQERVRALRRDLEDAESYLAMTNVIEQACNVYLETGAFPSTYEELQSIPVLTTSQLTFAGDDGMRAGQTYRAQVTLVRFCDLVSRTEQRGATLHLRLRTPAAEGGWAWGAWSEAIALPEPVVRYLEQGAVPQAPTLREIRAADGSRLAVLDLILEVPAKYVSDLAHEQRVLGFDWGIRSLITASIVEQSHGGKHVEQVSRPVFLDTGGIDGRQARLRREIDRLKARKERYEALIKRAKQAQAERAVPLPAPFVSWQERRDAYEARIRLCWKKYERRNRELAHLAANLLILLALLYDCRLIVGENLKTLKTIGRGRGVRGRWRNWRNNSQVRGELWRVLKYKCFLFGLRARDVVAEGTTHTCPHCHRPAKTYRSPDPAHRKKADDWGAFLCCSNPQCLWSGARDYAASLNIARLGLAFLETYHTTLRYISYRMTASSEVVKPVSYKGTGAPLLLQAQGITPRPLEGKQYYYAGWSFSIALRTAQTSMTLARLATARLRKRVLMQA